MTNTTIELPPSVGAAAPPGRPRRRGTGASVAATVSVLALGVLLFILVALPLGFVFYGALQSGGLGDPDSELTLESIRTVYTTAPFLKTLAGTAALSLAVGFLATLAGAAFAWILARTDAPGKRLLELIVLAPVFLSPFIGAVAWVTLAAPRSGMLNLIYQKLTGGDDPLINVMTVPGLVFVLSLYYVPYAYLFIAASLKNMDPSLEEASSMCGEGALGTARRITLPLVRPAIAASFFFISILTAGIFSVPAVLATGDSFIPLAVRVQRAVARFPSDHALAAAIGTVLFFVTLLGIVLYRRYTRLARRFVTITARGYRPRLVNMGRFRYVATALVTLYGLMAVALPYAALIVVAFTPYAMTDITNLTLSMDHFTGVLTSSSVLDATKNTLFVGVVSPTLCVIVGGLVAYCVERIRTRGVSTLDFMATAPIAIPDIVFATGMVWLYIQTPLYATIWVLVIAYVAGYLPHAVRLTSTGLIQIDRSLEEASKVSGASTAHTLRRVTVPLSKPALLAAWLMVFIFTVREISAAILLYSPQSRVLSVLTWDFIAFGRVQSAAVVGLLQTAFLLVTVAVAKFVFRVRLSSAA